MNDSPIRVSVGMVYKFQPRKYESMEVSIHLSQVPVSATDADISDATVQAHQLLSKGLNEIFGQAATAIDKAKGLPKADD